MTCQVFVNSTMLKPPKIYQLFIPLNVQYESWKFSSEGKSKLICFDDNDISKLELIKCVMQMETLPEVPILQISMPYPEAWANTVDKLNGRKYDSKNGD